MARHFKVLTRGLGLPWGLRTAIILEEVEEVIVMAVAVVVVVVVVEVAAAAAAAAIVVVIVALIFNRCLCNPQSRNELFVPLLVGHWCSASP